MQDYLHSIESTLLANAGLVVFYLFLTIAGSVVVKIVVRKALDRTSPASAGFIASIVQFAFVLGGLYLSVIAAGVDPNVILAIIAIMTAGVSLSADHSFKNIIAGAQIVANSKMRPGEWVTIGNGVHGVIQEVGLSSTIVASTTLGLVSMSNSTITENQIVNHTRLKNLEWVINFPMYDNHDRQRVIDIIHAVAEQVEGVNPDPIIQHTWTGSGENYEVVLKLKSFELRREIASMVSLSVTKALVDEKFPVGYATFMHAI